MTRGNRHGIGPRRRSKTPPSETPAVRPTPQGTRPRRGPTVPSAPSAPSGGSAQPLDPGLAYRVGEAYLAEGERAAQQWLVPGQTLSAAPLTMGNVAQFLAQMLGAWQGAAPVRPGPMPAPPTPQSPPRYQPPGGLAWTEESDEPAWDDARPSPPTSRQPSNPASPASVVDPPRPPPAAMSTMIEPGKTVSDPSMPEGVQPSDGQESVAPRARLISSHRSF